MSEGAANPFWDFSLRAYRRNGVAEACIRLQDRHDVDVNLLFYFHWLATVRPDALGDSEIGVIVAETDDWRRGVVMPLRAIRRRMKSGFDGFASDAVDDLRNEVKRLELQSERQEHDFLFARESPDRSEASAKACAVRAAENVSGYFRSLEVALDEADRKDCETVLDGCFGGWSGLSTGPEGR